MKIGDFNELEVTKETYSGVYFKSELGEILLLKKYVPEGVQIGDTLNVFLYTTKEGILATTLIPKVKVEEVAYLEVKDVNRYGAYLDWGLDKDLFLPYNEQPQKIMRGQKYIVRVYLDKITKRITASTKIHKFIEEEIIDLKEEETVNLLIYEFTDLGVKTIINNKYIGMIYKNDMYQDLKIGDSVIGYVKKIREDKKIDVSIRKTGREGVDESKEIIIDKLKENNNFLPLNDKSSPELIKDMLHMSKKTFKKAIGGLYKERIIELTEEGVRLK
ncbi:MAG: GntR family transcriptional regulator [Halanaerobiales bacterium]|nr:GntR family transcriptional regulator [Halanaerobiales bacterium]